MAIISFSVFAVVAYVHARFYRKNDYFNAMAIVLALLQFLDVTSDARFAIAVLSEYQNDKVPLSIPIAAWSFLVIPIAITLCQLHLIERKKWIKEDSLRQWMLTYSMMLIVAPILFGSAFTAIALLNCEAFQAPIFSMGLSRTQRMKFNAQRVWSVVMLEVHCFGSI